MWFVWLFRLSLMFGSLKTFITSLLIIFIYKLIKYALLAVGFGYVTYIGLGFAFSGIEQLINTHLSAIPQNLYQIFVFMGGKDAISMILSACSSVMTIKTISAVTRVRFSRNQQGGFLA